jgi:hypothetical protein
MHVRSLAAPLTALLVLLSACGSTEKAPAPAPDEDVAARAPEADPHEGVDHTDASTCAGCHAEVVTQWQESMHARAHQDNDPVYAGMRTLRMKKQGEGVAAKCAVCHNPMAPEAPDSPAGKAGVGCGACHGEGAVADASDGRTLCLHCHDATQNPAGVAACTTGPENQEAGGAACTACHMRATDGTVTHQFLGPHRAFYQDDPSLLARAVSVDLSREGRQLTLTVANTSAHGFPTGFPGRVAAIRLVAADDASGGKPLAAPEELTFFKRYVDEAGKPTMPPFAAKLETDTRLTPGERRTVTVSLPEGTGAVRAELVYRLLAPPAAKVLGLEEAPEAQPVVVPLATDG